MSEDLTPKILNTLDDTELLPGNQARPTTRLTFMLGRFGPFHAVLDRAHTGADIDAAMDARAANLRGRV